MKEENNDIEREEMPPEVVKEHEIPTDKLLGIVSWLAFIMASATLLPSIFLEIGVTFGFDISSIPAVLPTILFQIVLIGLYFYTRSRPNPEAIDRQESDKYSFNWGLKTWYLGWGTISIISAIISFIISSYTGRSTESAYEGLFGSSLDSILVILAAGILAPIAEELIFRKYLMDRLERHTSAAMTLVLSSILFSMIHWLSDFRQSTIDFTVGHIFSTFAMGLLLGYIYQMTGKIAIPIILHFISNSLPIIGLAIISQNPVSDEQLQSYIAGEDVSQEVVDAIMTTILINVLLLLIMSIASIWALVRFFKNLRQYTSNFREGIIRIMKLGTPNFVYASIFGFVSFVGIQLLMIQLIPPQLGIILGNLIVLVTSIVIIKRTYAE